VLGHSDVGVSAYPDDLTVDRATNDIDFAIVVESWDEFTRLQNNLIADKKFQLNTRMRQRLDHEAGLFIDLIPFGDLEEVSGQILASGFLHRYEHGWIS
jgi:predicted nucleotidyltransferase